MLEYLGTVISSHRMLISRIFAIAFFFTVLVMESVHEDSMVSAFLFLIGLVLVGIATVGRLWCSLYISGYKDSHLITTGPYSIIRNPLYIFSLIGFTGIGFATETFTLGVMLPLMFFIGYQPLIRREEEFLRSKFGAEFTEYCARTPRFSPSFSRFSESETYIVNPRLFRSTVGDVVWFVWFVGIIELVEALHKFHFFEPLIWLP